MSLTAPEDLVATAHSQSVGQACPPTTSAMGHLGPSPATLVPWGAKCGLLDTIGIFLVKERNHV